MSNQIVRLDEMAQRMLNLPVTADLESGWATVPVVDDANSPKLNPGDEVAVNRDVRRFDGDAMYLVEIDGEPLIRHVQMRGDGLHVYASNGAYAAISGVSTASLRVLGKCDRAVGWKPVAAV